MSSSLQSPGKQEDIWIKQDNLNRTAQNSYQKGYTPNAWRNGVGRPNTTNTVIASGRAVKDKQTFTLREEITDSSQVSRLGSPQPSSTLGQCRANSLVYHGKAETQPNSRKGLEPRGVYQKTACGTSSHAKNKEAPLEGEVCNNNAKKNISSVDLTKAKSYGKKPPIVSPKPFIAPKPRSYTDVAPSLIQNKKEKKRSGYEGQPSRLFSSSTSPPVVKTPISPHQINVISSAAESEERLFSTPPLPAKNPHSSRLGEKRTEESYISKPLKSASTSPCSQTLPRCTFDWNNITDFSESNKPISMDPQLFQYPPKNPGSNPERLGLKKPPKIAAKPKLKPPTGGLESSGPSKSNQRKIKDVSPEVNALANNDPASLMPVSDIRSKFEDMRIKFKKPVPDPVFESPTKNGYKESSAMAASELFKDILEMRTLEGFNDDTSQEAATPAVASNGRPATDVCNATGGEHASGVMDNANHSGVSRHNDDGSSDENKSKAGTEGFKNLKEKYEDGFKKEEVNSSISSSTNKPFSHNHDPAVLPPKIENLALNHNLYESQFSASDVPAPHSDRPKDFTQIDFMDLPPPPDLPPSTEAPSSDDIHSPVSQLERNAGDHKAIKALNAQTGFRQTGDHTIAPGFSSQNTTQPVPTSIDDKSYSADTTRHNSADGSLSNHSTQSCATASSESVQSKLSLNDSYRGKSEKSRLDNNSSGELDSEANYWGLTQPEPASNDVKKTRDIDEEILYYDNMDIMEKVRQKREQEEQFLRQSKLKQARDSPSNQPKHQVTRQDDPRPFPTNNAQNQLQNRAEVKSARDEHSVPAGQSELRSAIGDLEYEYLKLKANLDQESTMQNPPKLPPKQLKFNRQHAAQTADKSPVTEVKPDAFKEYNQPNPLDKTGKLSLDISATVVQRNLHMPSPMPTMNTPPLLAQPQANSTSASQAMSASLAQQQQNILARQLSPEDARARQLVDEPLAPIIEEDSTYGDSSSCASSVTGDDTSVFADDYSVHSAHKPYKRPESPLGSAWSSSVNSSRRNLDEDSELEHADGKATETEASFRVRSSASVPSSSSTEDASDASSVRWQENPMQSKAQETSAPQPSTSQLHSSPGGFPNIRSLKKSRNNSSDGIYEFHTDDDVGSVHSSRSIKRETSRDSRCSESSGTRSTDSSNVTKSNRFQGSEDVVEDVEPYGMVDLSKLQPTFEEIKHSGSRPVSKCSEPELTPSSIMFNVSQFNAAVNSQPKTPTKTRNFSFDGDGDGTDMPHFPLDVKVNNGKHPHIKTTSSPHHQRSKSDAEKRNQGEHEEVGYDNLENYGGAAREDAEKKRLREASLSAKYMQSVGKMESGEGRHDKTSRSGLKRNQNSNSRDSLSSEPGLARESAGSRSSFPLPTSESRLARHSSAVRAVDRHSGNLKRAKESARLESLSKSPASRRIEKLQQRPQQNQSSTLPRDFSQETADLLEQTPQVKHSRSTESFKFRQNNTESFEDARHSGDLPSKPQYPNVEHKKSFSDDQSSRHPSKPLPEKKFTQHQHHSSSSLSEAKPFPVPEDYDENLDDGVVNPYEEVPFLLDGASQKSSFVAKPTSESEEQQEAKTRVREILENIKPPESLYKPKLPLPRYPVDYDNFYLGEEGKKPDPKPEPRSVPPPQQPGSILPTPVPSVRSNIVKALEPSSLPRLRSLDDKASVYSDIPDTPMSTPAPVRAAHSRSSSNKGLSDERMPSLPLNDQENEEETTSRPEVTADQDVISESKPEVSQTKPEAAPRRRSSDASVDCPSGHPSDSNTNRSLGSQLRSLLGGSPEGKYISPSLRRKRSLLKRSKSPGGSRRSKTPPRSKSPSQQSLEEQTNPESVDRVQGKAVNDNNSKTESGKSSESESRDRVPPRRSASQRLMDRRGRSQKSKVSEEDSSEHTLERRKKELDKSKMTSKWRRSKSQDRQSPTRSKSKERKIFGRRSKSQERPDPKGFEGKDTDGEDKDREGRGFLRRHRSSSRKRDKRGKSSERSDDGTPSGGRGRNPVKFFKKLLRSKKESDEENNRIVHPPPSKGGNLSDSTEALSTILAYKSDEVSEKEDANPSRPTPLQRTAASFDKESPSVPPKPNKAMRSPPSRRAKKMSSASGSNRPRAEPSTGSSSEGTERTKGVRPGQVDAYGNMGPNRAFLAPPPKPNRPSSRKNSFSNSIPSSDSEQLNKSQRSDVLDIAGLKVQLRAGRSKQALKGGRKNLLLNRDYDSDTATSVLPSDAESSTGIQSDADNAAPGLRSAMKGGAMLKGVLPGAPRRPVRVISPQRSKSDPTIFTEEQKKNTYYNIEETDQSKSTNQVVEKKRSKLAPHRRKGQKQNRRQTAPVDLAYETHQRQKYKTLVSLNAQTLRKVTERWLSEWRNQLPVGGFLITSWSDVALASHRPLCMIGSSILYSAVSTGNKSFNLACQLYDQREIDDRMFRRLDNCASLPAHPNTCGVCSHFPCRVPRSLLDPKSGGGAVDAVCVVLTNRPCQSLQEFLDKVVSQEEPTEYHRQLLVNILQLLQGMKHLLSSGFDLPSVNADRLVITEDRRFLQILPHLNSSKTPGKTSHALGRVLDAYQSSDSDTGSSIDDKNLSSIQQVGRLMRKLLQNGNLMTATGGLGRPGDRSSAASSVSRVVVPGTKYSTAIKHLINYLEQFPPVGVKEATEVVQCALWGPEDLDDVGVDDVSPYSALELWIEMEQAKLVNSLAVLTPNDRLGPLSFLKHQYFASVVPDELFNGLKVLQRL